MDRKIKSERIWPDYYISLVISSVKKMLMALWQIIWGTGSTLCCSKTWGFYTRLTVMLKQAVIFFFYEVLKEFMWKYFWRNNSKTTWIQLLGFIMRHTHTHYYSKNLFLLSISDSVGGNVILYWCNWKIFQCFLSVHLIKCVRPIKNFRGINYKCLWVSYWNWDLK